MFLTCDDTSLGKLQESLHRTRKISKKNYNNYLGIKITQT